MFFFVIPVTRTMPLSLEMVLFLTHLTTMMLRHLLDSTQREHSIANDTLTVDQNSSIFISTHTNVSLSNDTLASESDLHGSR